MRFLVLLRDFRKWLRWPMGPKPPRLPRVGSVRQRRAFRALALIPFAFVALLAGGWSAAETITPEITDTEYHHRLKVLRAAVAEHPGHPVGLVMGSSRMSWGFRPEILPEPVDGEIYWLNGSQAGAGPVLNRLMLHRLLRDGLRPDFAVIEVMPAFFTRESTKLVVGHFAASEMPLVRRYGKFSLHYDYYFLRHRLWRLPDLARTFDPFDGIAQLLPRGGPPKIEEDVTQAERERRTELMRRTYQESLAHMTLRPGADRAFRETLDQAAAHGIRVVLLRTPESPTFKSWCGATGLARFNAYLSDVAREYGLPILDASDWLEESDFYDSHHALRRGADKFTLRFAREIVPLTGR